MTDHQQAAIEAAEDALRADIWDGDPEDIPPTMGREAELAVAAAEPYLRKKVRAEVAAEIAAREFAVASVHHFGFGKNGHKCLCGFSSPINRERTEHIIDMLGATKIAKGETK